MNWRQWRIGATAAAALVAQAGLAPAQAESLLIRFQGGVLCDEAGQVEEIISQYGKKPLEAVLIALNERTGKTSCGMVRRSVLLVAEPLKIVATPGGKMAIVKLTDRSGMAQYSWRTLAKSEPEGQAI